MAKSEQTYTTIDVQKELNISRSTLFRYLKKNPDLEPPRVQKGLQSVREWRKKDIEKVRKYMQKEMSKWMDG